MSALLAGFDSEANQILPTRGYPAPDTIASTFLRQSTTNFFFNYLRVELAKRLRALTLKLLPVEVDPESLTDPTSRVITHKVVSAYRAAGGDFEHAVSPLFFSEAFCHLRFSSRDSLWPDESCLNIILILALLFFVAAVLLATCS